MEKLYPLTPAQMVHHLPIRQLGTMQCINVSAVCALQAELDFEVLKKCVRLEFDRNECLRTRFTKPDKDGNVHQYILSGMTPEIPFRDLSAMTVKEADDLMQQWAFELFEEHDVPTCEITLLRLPEGYNGLYVHLDHRIADSCGMITLISDLMQLYTHFKFGAPMPEDLSSFKAMLEKDLKRETNSKRCERDENYWKETFDKHGEPLYADLTGFDTLRESRKKHDDKTLRAADIELNDAEVGVKDFDLDAESAKDITNFCLQHQVSMTNMLLLGLRTYLSKVNGGQEDITVRNFISRRSTHEEWTSGGTRTVSFPCRTIISPDTEFLDALYEVQDVQNHVYLHANYDPQKLSKMMKERFHTPDNTTYESLYLTYQPTPVKMDNEHLQNIPIWSNWYTNGINTKKCYLTVTHRPDGGMHFSFHYQTAHLTDHDMELLYYYLMRILFKGMAQPDMTVGDVMRYV
ncbi:MAG: chromosome condensation protein [Eubacterium sp.]|nr:chromosome condensation protein [Eubacterium sp.]